MDSLGEPWTEHRDELLERVVRRGRARKRARSFTITAVVVALIAALGAGVYFPNRGPKAVRVVANAGSTTTTSMPAQAARPSGVLLVGDSVMLGATIALENTIPGARVDAALSRQLQHAIPILAADKRNGDLPKTVVIHLGDNGPSGADATEQTQNFVGQIMSVVGPQTTVYFVSLKLPRPWAPGVNAGLYAAAAHFPNEHVLPWAEVGLSHPEWFTVDGFHLTPAGQTAYAEFVRDGVLGVPTTEAPGSPISADLDGDGRADQLHVMVRVGVIGAPVHLTAMLADGRTATGSWVGDDPITVLGAADIAGDGRHEVLIHRGGNTWELGAIVVLDGDHLVAITTAPDGFSLGWGQHSNSDPRGTVDLACRVVDGKPALVETSSTVAPGASVRKWKRSVWALVGAQLVLRKRDSGTIATTATPPPDLPLANTISCGTATLENPTGR